MKIAHEHTYTQRIKSGDLRLWKRTFLSKTSEAFFFFVLKAKSIEDTKNRRVLKFKYRGNDLRHNVKYDNNTEIRIATFFQKLSNVIRIRYITLEE